jgi:hypothetical protein
MNPNIYIMNPPFRYKTRINTEANKAPKNNCESQPNTDDSISNGVTTPLSFQQNNAVPSHSPICVPNTSYTQPKATHRPLLRRYTSTSRKGLKEGADGNKVFRDKNGVNSCVGVNAKI